MAPATESVDAIKATVAVGLDGASRLKLRKMSMNQQITTMSIGLEMEATDWAVSIRAELSKFHDETRRLRLEAALGVVARNKPLELVGDKDQPEGDFRTHRGAFACATKRTSLSEHVAGNTTIMATKEALTDHFVFETAQRSVHLKPGGRVRPEVSIPCSGTASATLWAVNSASMAAR